MALIKKDARHDPKSAGNRFKLAAIHHKGNGSKMLSMVETAVKSGVMAFPHACTNTEEAIYVLEGEFIFSYDEEEVKLSKGDCICYPAGVVRSYMCSSQSQGGLLSISPHPEPHWLRKPDRSIAVGSGKVNPSPDPSYVHRDYRFDPHLKGVARQTFCSPKIGARSTFASHIIISSGGTVPVHYHPQDDVSLYCIQGEIECTYGKESLTVPAGDSLLVEAGTVHGVKNKSLDEARFLEIFPTGEPEYVYTNQDGLDKSIFFA